MMGVNIVGIFHLEYIVIISKERRRHYDACITYTTFRVPVHGGPVRNKSLTIGVRLQRNMQQTTGTLCTLATFEINWAAMDRSQGTYRSIAWASSLFSLV